MLVRFLADEEGSTALEYALVASLIAMALVTVLTGIGLYLEGEMLLISDAAS